MAAMTMTGRALAVVSGFIAAAAIAVAQAPRGQRETDSPAPSIREYKPQSTLVVAQHPIPGDLLRWKRDAISRRLIQNRPANAPTQERFDSLQRLVGCNWRTPLLDCRDKLNHVALRDLVNAASTPCGAHFAAQQPRYLAP